LQILAKSSPLSRWAGQPVLNNVRFQLSLDDPKLPSEQWVTLQGDRAQLEALCEAVQTYVQQFLEQSHTHLNQMFRPVPAEVRQIAVTDSIGVAIDPPARTRAISLQPHGPLSHHLELGSLATQETGSTISLSTLQLFDLANALDDYATEVLTLPHLAQSSWLKPSRPWGQVAAAAVLLVATSASLMRVMDGATNRDTVPTTSAGASSSDQRLATQLPPTASSKAVPTLPSLPGQTLPPPPPLGSTVPSRATGFPNVTIEKSGSGSTDAPDPEQPENPIVAKATQPQAGDSTGQTAIPGEPIVVGKAATPAPPARARVAIADAPKRDNLALPAPSLSQSAPGAAALQPVPKTAANADAAPETAESAFDIIPQVAEARSFFQQRWQVPEGLTQPLEYQLVIDDKGAIQDIIPLGQAAGDFVDRSSIPLRGEPFVSPLTTGTTAKIRLVLAPDGTVQTFQVRD
jgi:hypothetical protein